MAKDESKEGKNERKEERQWRRGILNEEEIRTEKKNKE